MALTELHYLGYFGLMVVFMCPLHTFPVSGPHVPTHNITFNAFSVLTMVITAPSILINEGLNFIFIYYNVLVIIK